ncbi:MAG: UPF0175 family protein [Planctomycetes bacterium]|nr:UPF0175 family protein [Planctomycetota bacterium]
MTITLPDDLARGLGKDERAVLVEILVGLYKAGTVSLAYAADILGIDRIGFQRILKARGLALNYTEEDVLDDIRAAEKFGGQ